MKRLFTRKRMILYLTALLLAGGIWTWRWRLATVVLNAMRPSHQPIAADQWWREANGPKGAEAVLHRLADVSGADRSALVSRARELPATQALAVLWFLTADGSAEAKAALETEASKGLPRKEAIPGVDLAELCAARRPMFYQPFLGATKVVGITPLKDHNLCSASMTMKNWYGLLGGRRNQFHQKIHHIVSELAMMMRPTFVVLDATRVMLRNGPTGGSLSDVKRMDTLVVATDHRAADAYGYEMLLERDPADCYGGGNSELTIGRFLEKTGLRKQLWITTKPDDFAELPPWRRDFDAVDLTAAAAACPYGLDVAALVARARKVLG